MAASADPTVQSSARDELLRPPQAAARPDLPGVSWPEDRYPETELQRRAERTRVMIERARRQLM